MSRVSQGSINDIAYLYEEINIHQNDFLNEESEYYDSEAAEIVEDILSTISISMVYEGYSAEAIIGFLADSSEETIIEKYLSFDENILTESVVPEDYILEQLEIFDVAIDEGIGSLIGRVAKGALGLAGRIASKPARNRVSKILSNAKNPEEARKMLQRVAQDSARKSNVGGYSSTMSPVGGGKLTGRQSAELLTKAKIGQGVQKVKDIAKAAKAALTGTTARRIAKGAAIVGLSGLGGYLGAKMGGAGEVKPSQIPRPDQPSTPPRRDNPPTPPAAPGGGSGTPSGGGGGGGGTPSGGAGGAGRSTSQTRTPQPSGQTGDKEKDMETWARANPTLAARVKPGQAGWDVISRLRDKPSDYEKQDQTPTQGSPTAQIDPSSVQASIEAENERMKKRAEQQRNTTTTTTPTTTTTKESYEPYDIILEYLIGRGHADTINEANYIMMEMDQNAIGIIMQEYNDYLLAEEVSEWVDGLLEEGYDLSDYTWDDIVEYYVTEANREEREKGMNKTQRTERRNKGWENPENRPNYNSVAYQRNRRNDPTPKLGDPSELSGRNPGNREYHTIGQVFGTELPSGRIITGKTNQYVNPSQSTRERVKRSRKKN
jgi:hypothetical protein